MGRSNLRKEVRLLPRRSNRWWYKLTALSFTVKVLLVLAIFFGIRLATDRSAIEAPVPEPAQPAEAK